MAVVVVVEQAVVAVRGASKIQIAVSMMTTTTTKRKRVERGRSQQLKQQSL
jgi:hypothetical protein